MKAGQPRNSIIASYLITDKFVFFGTVLNLRYYWLQDVEKTIIRYQLSIVARPEIVFFPVCSTIRQRSFSVSVLHLHLYGEKLSDRRK
jgi:hypothetical protein